MKSQNILTKTDFRLFLNAPRHLWAKAHNKLQKQKVEAFLQHIFDQGYKVEKLAEDYIKNHLIRELKVGKKDILFQPTHCDGNYMARIDVLIKNPESEKWDMYEIKSGTGIKPIHKLDVTFQALVFQTKFEIGEVFIIHLNKHYVRRGEIDLAQLFQVENVTKAVHKLSPEVAKMRKAALNILSTDNMSDTLACVKPKDCPCLDLCHADMPEYSVFNIVRMTGNEKKLRELIQISGKDIFDVPKDFELSEKQRRQVDSVQNDEIYIDYDAIQNDLDGLAFPLHFIDYEAFNPAIPPYDGYKPFDFMPFQYSLHILDKVDGRLSHEEFIVTEQVDPIPHLLEALKKNLKNQGSIIVWNKDFEGRVNHRMAEIHPEYNNVCSMMNERMYDLMDIFQNLWYIDPGFMGSYSLKKVLPVLVPELSYDGMEIGDGATAMAEWEKMLTIKDSIQKSHVTKNLLKYCELDTLATVRIWQALMKKLESRIANQEDGVDLV